LPEFGNQDFVFETTEVANIAGHPAITGHHAAIMVDVVTEGSYPPAPALFVFLCVE
jgi:hypothetical protein